ncbi:MAG: hypothetical protein KA168_01330, partial [Chitinophagales bacterium]|nr:hypothetical protein [Chitinophagales bacterium]
EIRWSIQICLLTVAVAIVYFVFFFRKEIIFSAITNPAIIKDNTADTSCIRLLKLAPNHCKQVFPRLALIIVISTVLVRGVIILLCRVG